MQSSFLIFFDLKNTTIAARRGSQTPTRHCSPLEQPHVEEEHAYSRKEQQPHFPAHAGTLSHEQHAVHRPAEAQPRRVECVVHLLRERGRVADFVADGHRHLHGRVKTPN